MYSEERTEVYSLNRNLQDFVHHALQGNGRTWSDREATLAHFKIVLFLNFQIVIIYMSEETQYEETAEDYQTVANYIHMFLVDIDDCDRRTVMRVMHSMFDLDRINDRVMLIQFMLRLLYIGLDKDIIFSILNLRVCEQRLCRLCRSEGSFTEEQSLQGTLANNLNGVLTDLNL